MPAIRKSYKLNKFSATELHQVAAGKSLAASVAVLNPTNLNLFVQKTAITAPFTVGSATPITPTIADMYIGSVDLKTGGNNRINAASTTYVDISAASTNIGFRYTIGTNTLMGTPTELKPTNATYYLKSLPVIDYAADPLLNRHAFINQNGTFRFYGYTNLNTTGLMKDVFTGLANDKYTQSPTYYSAGGASYSSSAVSIDLNGYTTWWFNSWTGNNNAASASYTSETSTYSPYWLKATNSRDILAGSPQTIFIDSNPYVWCSGWSVGNTPMMALCAWSTIDGGNYSSWSSTSSVTFSGSVNGEKLYWLRYCGSKFLVGSSTDSIYVTANSTFNQGYTKLTGIPTDVDVQMPPIRKDANTLCFRSKTGSQYHSYNPSTNVWTVVATNTAAIFGYVADPLLAPAITTAGISPITSLQTGTRSTDVTLYTLTNSYPVINNFDGRSTSGDLVQSLSTNAERTNIVLEAGDRIFAYTEGANTIAHIYGFEE